MTGVDERRFGLGKGAVYPAEHARALLNPARRVVQSPRRVVRAAGVPADARVLELGCGPGWFSPELARVAGLDALTYFDLQPAMLGHTRRRTGSRRLVAGDAQRLPFADGAFDVVFLSAVLGEVPDRALAWAELARVVPTGGFALFVETRTDPDFVPHDRLAAAARHAGFDPAGRRRSVLGFVARFVRV